MAYFVNVEYAWVIHQTVPKYLDTRNIEISPKSHWLNDVLHPDNNKKVSRVVESFARQRPCHDQNSLKWSKNWWDEKKIWDQGSHELNFLLGFSSKMAIISVSWPDIPSRFQAFARRASSSEVETYRNQAQVRACRGAIAPKTKMAGWKIHENPQWMKMMVFPTEKHGWFFSIVMLVFGGEWYFLKMMIHLKMNLVVWGPGSLDSIRCFMFTAKFHGVWIQSLKLTTSFPLKLYGNPKRKSDCLPFPAFFKGLLV